MPSYTTESIRSIALVGHGGAGKTTLAEALLLKAGAIKTKGAVEKGSTVCDYDPQEKAAGHSLQSALVNFAFEGVHVHLIDTPGYPDFSGQAMAALAGVERETQADGETGWVVLLHDLTEKLPVSRRQWPQIKALLKDEK